MRYMIVLILAAVLVSSTTVVTQSVNSTIPQAEATASNKNPAMTITDEITDGRIYYVQLDESDSTQFELDVQATDEDSNLLNISTSELPEGAVFTYDVTESGDSASGTFSWDLENLKDFPSAAFPMSFGVTFTANDEIGASSEPVTILVFVEEDIVETEITFDKSNYASIQDAWIIVRDPHANLNDLSLDTVGLEVSENGNSTTVELVESPDDYGLFRGKVDINILNGSISANYQGENASASIGHAVWFDKEQYVLGSEAMIQVLDIDANADSQAVDTVSVEISSSSDNIDTELDETGPNTAIFVGVLSLGNQSQGNDNLMVTVGDEAKANYKDVESGTIKIFPTATGSFDAEGYTIADDLPSLANFNIVDSTSNKNNKARDVMNATVSTQGYPNGIQVELIETGPNTATFVNVASIVLTTDVSSPESFVLHADPDDKLRVVFEYEDRPVIVEQDVDTDEPDDRVQENGTGTNGVPPTEGVPIGSISVINCGSFGGDTDHDGICDQWEDGGLLSIPYPDANSWHTIQYTCDPTCAAFNHKDIFVEVDYTNFYSSTTINSALTAVKTAFNSASLITNADGITGIRLHYKISDNIGTLALLDVWSDPTPDPAVDSFTEVKQTWFGVGTERSDTNLKYAKRQIYHYGLFVNKQTQDQGSSGKAEYVANDFIVSLGSFSNSVDQEKGTFMHELGHNIGLDHGGGLSVHPPVGTSVTLTWVSDHGMNCKPNYPSVMSYMRQFTNAFSGNTLSYSSRLYSPTHLPVSISQLDEVHPTIPRPTTGTIYMVYAAPNPAFLPPPGTFNPNIPLSDSNPLNPERLIKVVAVTPTTAGIDWNYDNNGVGDDPSVANYVADLRIHGCPTSTDPINPADGKLYDRLDWSNNNLVLDFRFHLTGPGLGAFANGVGTSTSAVKEITAEAVKEIHYMEIYSIDSAIQGLDDSAFVDGNSKEMLHDMLLGGPNNVASLIQFDEVEKALAQLESVREKMDNSTGGDPTDDKIKDEFQQQVLDPLDRTLISLKTELDLPYAGQFEVSSHLDDNTYTIIGKSQGVTATSSTFKINPHDSIVIDLNGQGEVELIIPDTIAYLTQEETTIFIDGNMTSQNEIAIISDGANNIVKFSLPQNARMVTIMDTTVIPEFPVTPAIVLSIILLATILMITVGRRKGMGLFFGRS